MQVAARGRDRAVSHRGLDRDEVGAARGEQRAECVPQVVEAQRPGSSRLLSAQVALAQCRAVERPSKRVAEDEVPAAEIVLQLTEAQGEDRSRGFLVFEGAVGRRAKKVMMPGYAQLRAVAGRHTR